jgi:hypothetical protein
MLNFTNNFNVKKTYKKMKIVYFNKYNFSFINRSILVLGMIFISNSSMAQETDSIYKKQKEFKNTVKFNVTNMLLYDTSYQFSYERVIKENQSFTVFAGYQNLPFITSELGENLVYKGDNSRTGFSVGGDYRFYLGSINKFKAPRGIYLAPFASYFNFNTKREIQATNSDTGIVSSIDLDTKLGLASIGGELGYQFVLWDRFVIDCILLGPSVSYYTFNVKASADIPGLDDNELADEIIEALKQKFPSLGDITDADGATKNGVQSITALGFRYSISIGYRF